MSTLVVSDLHLTHIFDEKKYTFLVHLFSSYNCIILNGDFWDGFSTTFDRFITSKWSSLFPILQQKNAVYIFGNHDKEEYCDSRTSLFSATQTHNCSFQEGPILYHCEHGHLLEPSIDGIFSMPRSLLWHLNFWVHLVENILVRLGSPQNIIIKQANKGIKRKLKKRQFPHWYLCGHTHIAEYDEKSKFANSGFIQYGKATYLVVNSSGVELKKERYK